MIFRVNGLSSYFRHAFAVRKNGRIVSRRAGGLVRGASRWLVERLDLYLHAVLPELRLKTDFVVR